MNFTRKISIYFKSVAKNSKLANISRKLDQPVDYSFNGMMSASIREESAINDLYNLSQSFEPTKLLLDKFEVDLEIFKELYSNLLLIGLGQWKNRHFIASSSLVFAPTLEYVLKNRDIINEGIKPKDGSAFVLLVDLPEELITIATNLINFF